ncbi:MAG: TssN family type VI secretion system protein [Bacteroidota bacterium]
MQEPLVIVWAILIFIIGILFVWVIKRKKRKLGKYVAVHKLGLMLLSTGIGFLLFYFFYQNTHLIWVSRLTFLLLGILNVWVAYSQDFTERDTFDYKKDSMLPEVLFMLLHAFLATLAFTIAPQMFGLVKYEVDVSMLFGDLPLVFILPFLVFKVSDLASQVPYRSVENPWVYPLEAINAESWPWRNLMQINFQVKKSLLEEYHLFDWPVNPWIEAPKEITLGNIFCLIMQERRQRRELTTIQDLGNEYTGEPQFGWLFSIKVIWWNPSTWFRSPRYLNPDLSMIANKVKKRDIIVARRVPWVDQPISASYAKDTDYDSDRTVIVHR